MTVRRRLALVTGASSGIGAAFARQLVRRGCDLILVARRADRLNQLAEELTGDAGVHAEVLPADLTKDEELAVVERRLGDAEDLQYLVNNAGFGTRGKFFEADRESQDRMHRLHVLATLRLTHAALPGMVGRRTGSVINVSSVAAFWETPGNASYSATKAWMNSFTEALALELKSVKSPVKVQALCPGFTYTEFHDVMGVDRKVIPGPLWMSAETVVAASLRGLDRGQVIVVPGLPYKCVVLLSRLAPPGIKRAMVSVYAKRMKRA